MTDIVERLAEVKVIREFTDGLKIVQNPEPIKVEAAAEITRLREALAAETEECALVVRHFFEKNKPWIGGLRSLLEDLEAAIRARKEPT